MKWIYTSLSYLFILLGCFLTAANIYGTFVELRPPNIINTNLRFHNDLALTHEDSAQQVQTLLNENPLDYSARLAHVISKSLAHIDWYNETDNQKYNQLIPIWENYLLYFMGKFSGIPEFQRYHYTNYKRSLRRGVGICGDASIAMSQLLDKQSIPNQIISFPGHVVVSAIVGNKEWVFDPDYGVVLPISLDQLNQTPTQVYQHYKDIGYSSREVNELVDIYKLEFERWNGVSHFMTNKYYFEKLVYFVKWPLPIVLIIVGLIFIGQIRVDKKHKRHSTA